MPDDGVVRFLALNKRGQMTFPPTKFRPGETLYTALVRTMEGNWGLPPGTYFPERELEMIPNDVESPHYAKLPDRWYLYPVDLSLDEEASARLEKLSPETASWTLPEIQERVSEPNILAIARYLQENHPELLTEVCRQPSIKGKAYPPFPWQYLRILSIQYLAHCLGHKPFLVLMGFQPEESG